MGGHVPEAQIVPRLPSLSLRIAGLYYNGQITVPPSPLVHFDDNDDDDEDQEQHHAHCWPFGGC